MYPDNQTKIGEPRMAIKCFLFLVALASGLPAHADLGSDPYFIPLVGQFGIYRGVEGINYPLTTGKYSIVLWSKDRNSGEQILGNVKSVAVYGFIIIGTTHTGYFMVDTSKGDVSPTFFANLQLWNESLIAAGITPNPQLSKPDNLAEILPDHVIHPFYYESVVHTRFVACILDFVFLAVAFYIGRRFFRENIMLVGSILLAISVLVASYIQNSILGNNSAARFNWFSFDHIFLSISTPIAMFRGRMIGSRIRKTS